MQTSETIAVLGAGGTMGWAMARNMARAGLSVRAWNRTRDKAEPLSDDGVSVAGTPAEAARGAGIVVTMLSDADAVISALVSAMPAVDATADPHVIWLQMSTIGEAATKRCIGLANSNGIGFVDAPVLVEDRAQVRDGLRVAGLPGEHTGVDLAGLIDATLIERRVRKLEQARDGRVLPGGRKPEHLELQLARDGRFPAAGHRARDGPLEPRSPAGPAHGRHAGADSDGEQQEADRRDHERAPEPR